MSWHRRREIARLGRDVTAREELQVISRGVSCTALLSPETEFSSAYEPGAPAPGSLACAAVAQLDTRSPPSLSDRSYIPDSRAREAHPGVKALAADAACPIQRLVDDACSTVSLHRCGSVDACLQQGPALGAGQAA